MITKFQNDLIQVRLPAYYEGWRMMLIFEGFLDVLSVKDFQFENQTPIIWFPNF